MAEIQNISIELVKVHPNNVRKTYNDIEELAESIKAKGILQNLTVVPDPQERSERRYRSCREENGRTQRTP